MKFLYNMHIGKRWLHAIMPCYPQYSANDLTNYIIAARPCYVKVVSLWLGNSIVFIGLFVVSNLAKVIEEVFGDNYPTCLSSHNHKLLWDVCNVYCPTNNMYDMYHADRVGDITSFTTTACALCFSFCMQWQVYLPDNGRAFIRSTQVVSDRAP